MRGVTSPLLSRALVSVRGKDAESLLQSLVATDVSLVPGSAKSKGAGRFPVSTSRATCLLTNKGRVAFDALLVRVAEDAFVVDCDEAEAESVVAAVRRFVLRRDVRVERMRGEWRAAVAVVDGRQGGAASGSVVDAETRIEAQSVVEFTDPRPGLRNHVRRVWTSTPERAEEWMSKTGLRQDKDDRVFHALRMAMGIPEGAAECKEQTPFTLNFDMWPDTLAYDKGCYVGQELVARTHFKGVVRTRVVPVLLGSVSPSTPTPVTPRPRRDGDDNNVLPAFLDWVSDAGVVPPSQPLVGKGAVLEPIADSPSKPPPEAVGEIIAVAPFRRDLALAAVKHAMDFCKPPLPDKGAFEPTHVVKLEGGGGAVATATVMAHALRPTWWP